MKEAKRQLVSWSRRKSKCARKIHRALQPCARSSVHGWHRCAHVHVHTGKYTQVHTLAYKNSCAHAAPKSMHTRVSTALCRRTHNHVLMHMCAHAHECPTPASAHTCAHAHGHEHNNVHRTPKHTIRTFLSSYRVVHSFMQQTYVEPFLVPGQGVGTAHPAERTRSLSSTSWELTAGLREDRQ